MGEGCEGGGEGGEGWGEGGWDELGSQVITTGRLVGHYGVLIHDDLNLFLLFFGATHLDTVHVGRESELLGWGGGL
jgi:hypothetical protein